MRAIAKPRGMIAGILGSGLDDFSRPIGIRTVVTDEPWRFWYHLQPGERMFVIPGTWLEMPVPYDLWPWTVGAAEIHVATCIWPEPMPNWGVWEAKRYFNNHVVPLMDGRDNRPVDWWKRPADWAAR